MDLTSQDSSQFSVNIYCVLPRGCTELQCPRELFSAYDCCKDNNFNVSFLKEHECLTISPKKADVFILDKFEGKNFERLRKHKCTIIGPRCLLVCVHKSEPLPEIPYPVYTVAMRGLIVTSTGFTPQEKAALAEKIHFMGGIYNAALHAGTTHLIVKTVAEFSQKYQVATNKDIPVMTSEWVDEVWKMSCMEDVHGADQQFSKFVCPPFKGLVICVSQIPKNDRDLLRKIIENNGGEYSGQLEMGKTHILVLPVAGGEKFDYARRWKIKSVRPEWIHDSIEKGFAIDFTNYAVERNEKSLRCSTPERESQNRSFINSSAVSAILAESHTRNVNETTDVSFVNFTDTLDTIDLDQVKAAGSFLDGCRVFLSGFEGPRMEKLRKIVNTAGAARFNSITETLSHVIVGTRVEEHFVVLSQAAHKPHVVSLDWIVASCKMRQPAPEAPYTLPEFRRATDKDKENEKTKPALQESSFYEDAVIMGQYLDLQKSQVAEAETQPSVHNESVAVGIFGGLAFYLEDLNDLNRQEVASLILENGGKISSESNADYAIISLEPKTTLFETSARQTVNYLWVEDCVDAEKVVPVEYFHRAVRVKDQTLLKNSVVAQSGLDSKERLFVAELCKALGGISQETFSRKTLAARNILACTHLICSKAEGKKYEAAVTWNVPVVHPQWLVGCASSGKRLPESDFPPGMDVTLNSEVEEQGMEVLRRSVGSISVNQEVAQAAQEGGERNSRLFPGEFPTPTTPYGRFLTEDPSPAARKAWKRALDDSVRPSPRSPSYYNYGQGSSHGSRSENPQVQDEINEFFDQISKRVILDQEANQEKEVEPRSVTTNKSAPFEGVVAYVHQSLKAEMLELQQIILKLGGETRNTNDPTVTHFIYSGKSKNSKEMRQSKDWNQHQVTHHWVLDCEDAYSRLEEKLYPCNFNPKMSLSLTVSATQQKSSQKRVPPVATPRTGGPKSAKKRLVQLEEEQVAVENNEDLACEILMKLDKEMSNIEPKSAGTRKSAAVVSVESRKAATQSTEAAESQGAASVVWDLTESQPISGRSCFQNPCVVFSSMEPDDKERYGVLVESMGGSVSQLASYDESSTHIVVYRPARNEKLVSSIAAGKWVVYPSWLDESKRLGYFVEESVHEWGNPAARNLPLLSPGTNEALLAAASYKWRLKRKMNRGQPFDGFKAILHLKDKNGAFLRLLTAGGGAAVAAVPPYTDPLDANICLVDPKGSLSIDMEGLAARGIPCVPVVFLSQVLTNEEIILKDAVVSQFVPFLSKMPLDRGIAINWKR